MTLAELPGAVTADDIYAEIGADLTPDEMPAFEAYASACNAPERFLKKDN
jgi:hypothetical protein